MIVKARGQQNLEDSCAFLEDLCGKFLETREMVGTQTSNPRKFRNDHFLVEAIAQIIDNFLHARIGQSLGIRRN